jgi:hypothetical protein
MLGIVWLACDQCQAGISLSLVYQLVNIKISLAHCGRDIRSIPVEVGIGPKVAASALFFIFFRLLAPTFPAFPANAIEKLFAVT